MKTTNGSVVLKVLTSVERVNGELGLINERRLPPTVLVLIVAKNWYEFCTKMKFRSDCVCFVLIESVLVFGLFALVREMRLFE